MYAMVYMYDMATQDSHIPEAQGKFLKELARLWPVAKGSLAEVRKPCVRRNCSACVRGEKHPSFIFLVVHSGRRLCLHVPRERVPELRKAIQNGRRLQRYISQMGVELVRGFRKKSHAPAANRPGQSG
jgi:hypothetical protein